MLFMKHETSQQNFFSNFLALICPKKDMFKRKRSQGEPTMYKNIWQKAQRHPETTQQNPVKGQE